MEVRLDEPDNTPHEKRCYVRKDIEDCAFLQVDKKKEGHNNLPLEHNFCLNDLQRVIIPVNHLDF